MNILLFYANKSFFVKKKYTVNKGKVNKSKVNAHP
jgi:hypothetical protein